MRLPIRPCNARMIDSDKSRHVAPHGIHRGGFCDSEAPSRPIRRQQIDLLVIWPGDVGRHFGPARRFGVDPPSVPVTTNSWPCT